MKTMRKALARFPGALLGVVVAATACAGTATATDLQVATDAELLEALTDAIQDEYHAEAVYLGVMADFGDVRPFTNILGAEQRHSSAIAWLFESRGWAVPTSEWSVENVVHFDSVTDACRTGVSAEIANVAVYDRWFAELTLPADVARVFEANRAASLDRHLPAFQRCAGV